MITLSAFRTTCRAPNCKTKTRSGLGQWCEYHRQRRRRHGEATQQGIRKQELAPFVKVAQRIVARDSSGRVETALREIHTILTDHVRSVAVDADRGAWVPKWTARAAREMLKVLVETPPLQCACTVAGVFLLREHQPYLFVSERAFRFELVRHFHKLVATAWGSYYDEKAGRVKKTYRDLPPRTVPEIGATLIEGYARFVGHVLRVDQRERVRGLAVKTALDEGFAALEQAASP